MVCSQALSVSSLILSVIKGRSLQTDVLLSSYRRSHCLSSVRNKYIVRGAGKKKKEGKSTYYRPSIIGSEVIGMVKLRKKVG
ncbi:hypothetical protein F5X98DRAFT_326682 [Xylaria grammica]|nr:hypothetical protein F5X98DRAFT_326682 [Xylaria grammica]